jgi:hypothetical protein
MRLRFTAFPSAFLMLQPKRLSSIPLGRRKTANSRLDRRRPSRYTASYSTRRTSRPARGNPYRGGSDARETVAPFLAALRKDFPSTLALHPCAEAMLLMTAAHVRLKSAFRQRVRSLIMTISLAPAPVNRACHHASCKPLQIARAKAETASVVEPRSTVKEPLAIAAVQTFGGSPLIDEGEGALQRSWKDLESSLAL